MRRGFTIHHNGPPARCVGQPHSRCEAFWRAVRDFHVNGQGWSDIAYSFGVCPHGIRFVGRGWDRNQFANGSDDVGEDDGADRYWYTVLVFLGGDEKPTAPMELGVRNLIDEGRRTGRCGMRVTPHNFWKRKACPGPEFTVLAAEWDNQSFAPPAPPPEEDDMALFDTVDEFKNAVREAVEAEFTTAGDPTRTAVLELSRRGALYGSHFLAIPDDFAQGGTVYWTDLATKVGFPQGSPRHHQIKEDLANQGLSTAARRLPTEVLDAIPDVVDEDPEEPVEPEPGPTG